MRGRILGLSICKKIKDGGPYFTLFNLQKIKVGGPDFTPTNNDKQVAQWATIAHHGASIMFGDTIIIYNAQRQINLNLKQ